MIPEAAIEAAAEAHRKHDPVWATQYDGRGGIAHEDNGGLRCRCGDWERGPVNGIRPWSDYHAHAVRAAIEAAMPAIREAIAQEVESANDLIARFDAGRKDAARIVRGGTP